MKAIILAAGRGSRMKAMTDGRPKCLIEIRGKPLLDWQLSALRIAGIDQIAIVTGYRRELLQGRGITEFYNSRWAQTNMVSSLVCADEWLSLEPCVVTYSDIFYEPKAVISLTQSPEDIAITYDPNWLTLWKRRFVDPLADAETFRLNQDNTLAEIGNKLKTLEEAQGQYMGLLKFTPKGWKEILRLRAQLPLDICDKMHMTGTLQKVIEAKRIQVSAISYRGAWGEIDFTKDLSTYE